MQPTPISFLIDQCAALMAGLEALDAKQPKESHARPLFKVDGLRSDIQWAYALEWLLMRLEPVTGLVQAEIADAIADLLETISLTYGVPGRPGARPS